VALCADALVNPPPGAPDVLRVLEQEGWAAVQLPAPDDPPGVVRGRLALIAEECDELQRRGYALLLLSAPGVAGGGVHRAALRRAFRRLGQELPPEHAAPSNPAELARLLRAQPAPAAAG
jgi:hypothetical protein